MSSTSWSRKTFGNSLEKMDSFCGEVSRDTGTGRRIERTFAGALPPLDELALRGLVRSWTVRSAMVRVNIVNI